MPSIAYLFWLFFVLYWLSSFFVVIAQLALLFFGAFFGKRIKNGAITGIILGF
jgi:hypothetical protein